MESYTTDMEEVLNFMFCLLDGLLWEDPLQVRLLFRWEYKLILLDEVWYDRLVAMFFIAYMSWESQKIILYGVSRCRVVLTLQTCLRKLITKGLFLYRRLFTQRKEKMA